MFRSFISVTRLIGVVERGILWQVSGLINQPVTLAKLSFQANSSPKYTIQNVVDEMFDQFGGQKVWNPIDYDETQRSNLLAILPKSQEELPTRRLKDSYCEAVIPLGDDVSLRDKYVNNRGGVRFGRILEDIDVFAVWVCHKFVVNPLRAPGSSSPFCIVTALVDDIDLHKQTFTSHENIKLCGQVSWVGRTSLESTIRLYQERKGIWEEILVARFVMVARDPLNRGAAFVNPVNLDTPEDIAMFQEGEANNKLRKKIAQESLMNLPPTEEERALVHELFLKTIDTKTYGFNVRVKPENAEWMSSAKSESIIICHPQERNVYDKIFGGFLMRQAVELAWALGFVYSKGRPNIIRVDDIWFRKPVEIGSLLHLLSQVVYTNGNHMQIHVTANVMDPTTGVQETTNVFHFTFSSSQDVPVKMVVPNTYGEAMLYLDGKRHYDVVFG